MQCDEDNSEVDHQTVLCPTLENVHDSMSPRSECHTGAQLSNVEVKSISKQTDPVVHYTDNGLMLANTRDLIKDQCSTLTSFSQVSKYEDTEHMPTSSSIYSTADTTCGDTADLKCSTVTNLISPPAPAVCALTPAKDSGECDSGFSTLQSHNQQSIAGGDEPTAKVANSKHQDPNKLLSEEGNIDSGITTNSESNPVSHPKLDFNYQIVTDEVPDQDDEDDILDEMAFEAGLPCLASNQPMTSSFENQYSCSDTDLLEYYSCDQFDEAIPEEGSQESSFFSVNDQTIVVHDDQPSDMAMVREPTSSDLTESDQDDQHSVEDESSVNVHPSPAKFIYNNTPYPRQENEIHVQLEASEDMQGAAVTVESYSLQDISLAEPPKPPDININLQCFLSQYGDPECLLVTMLQDYPPPVQEAGRPMPSK